MRKLDVIQDKEPPESIAEMERSRPKTRGDCVDGLRPCPFVSCQFNTYLHTTKLGEIKTMHECDVDEMTVSNCALDYESAELSEIAAAFGTSRQAVDQLIASSLRRIASSGIEFTEPAEPRKSNLAWAQDLL